MNRKRAWSWASGLAIGLLIAGSATADEIRVLTAGAFKHVVLAVAPGFEKESGHRLVVTNDTAGGVARRVQAGEAFDLVIVTPAQMKTLSESGKVDPKSVTAVAKAGVGVAIRDGAPKPDIGTVEAFRAAILAAPKIAYIDPAAGGSSGIYFAGLLQKLGIAETMKPRSVLVNGGLVGDRITDGSADLAIQQISELVGMKGLAYVGPLPAEIQSWTTYAAALPPEPRQPARTLLARFRSPEGEAILKSRGLEAP